MIIIQATKVPRRRKTEKVRRVIVEFFVDGQHPQRRHGAVPHRHEAYGEIVQDI